MPCIRLQSENMIVGLDAVSAYSELINSLPDVAVISVFEYQTPPPVQSRSSYTDEEAHITEKALEIRERYKMPFWDALLLSCFSVDKVPRSILEAASLHVSHRDLERQLTRSEIDNGDLSKMAALCGLRSCIAVISEV